MFLRMNIPHAAALAAAAKIAIGAKSDADVAFAIRKTHGLRKDQSLVNRWINGERSPDYDGTMALLELAGWLNEDAVQASLPAAEAAAAAAVARRAGHLAEREEHAQDKRRREPGA